MFKEHHHGLQLVRIKAMFDLRDVPSSQGTYVLRFFISRSRAIVIGRLGQHQFPVGHYFYVGSARGAGGLRARVGRHLRGDGARHWHIDYLRAVAEVRDVLYTVTDSPLECAWSQALAQLPRASIPVPHFGSSDCRMGCKAHLIALSHDADLDLVLRTLAQISPTPIAVRQPTVR